MGKKGLIFLATVLLFLGSCGPEERRIERPIAPAKPKITLVPTPEFNGDSAYAFVEKQVAFGPRVPNTAEHKACAKWLEEQLGSYGFEPLVQEATVTAFDGSDLEIYNIMGRYRPELSERILLAAHWDTRPFADRGNERKMHPIDGANDGGSGVGVILEIARAIHSADSLFPGIGIDVVFFDGEDYGKPESSMTGNSNGTWCLGSQYWSANLPIANYNPSYGILLDMVGATNAVFPKEGVSVYYAPEVVENVWGIAAAMGHKDFFSSIKGNPLIDDHRYVNEISGIKMIDIIHYETLRSDFGTFHHTHDDNMDIIDKGTLKVVGDVLLQVIYQE